MFAYQQKGEEMGIFEEVQSGLKKQSEKLEKAKKNERKLKKQGKSKSQESSNNQGAAMIDFDAIVQSPTSFENMIEITNILKKNKSVTVNFSAVSRKEFEIFNGFVCGFTLALNGEIEKIDKMMFVFTPHMEKEEK